MIAMMMEKSGDNMDERLGKVFVCCFMIIKKRMIMIICLYFLFQELWKCLEIL